MDKVLVNGYYEHYRNHKYYKVVCIATHKSSLKDYVVYQAQYNDPEYGDLKVWIRDIDDFLEIVTDDLGNKTPKFVMRNL